MERGAVDDRRRPLQSGATFFGVMMATVLISLAAIPLMTAIIERTRQTKVSEMHVFATHLAQNLIERVRLESCGVLRDLLPTIEAGARFVQEDPLLACPDGVGDDYRRLLAQFTRTIVFAEVSPRAGMVEAIVQWSEDGHPREISLKTVVVDTEFPGGRPP